MKKHLPLFLFFFGMFSAFSQVSQTTEIEKERNEIIDELFQEDIAIDELVTSLTHFQFLYFSVNYSNDTYFSGRDIGIDQYNIRPQITYLNSNGIFASLYGIYYSGFDPKWDVTSATIGYGKNFGKKKLFKYYTSYSRYFNNNSITNIFNNDLSVGLSVRNEKKTVGTQITGSYLFGNEQSFQVISTSYITLNLLKTKKSKLALKPQLNIIAGQQTIELAQSNIHMGQTTTTYTKNNVFDLINTQLNIPLQFSTHSFDFELGYNINFPTAIGDESNLKSTNFFNLSVAYLIDL
jgi:hypothetical protein